MFAFDDMLIDFRNKFTSLPVPTSMCAVVKISKKT